MEKQTHFLFLLILFSFGAEMVVTVNGIGSHGHHHHHNHHQQHIHNGSVRLFVFGDSYADTGNSAKSSSSWKKPYGITFPGKPAGRFSDGRVLTDYVASFLGIKSPVPFKWRKFSNKSRLKHGMNFAYGGTGVFYTSINEPNMTTQIDFFQQLLGDNLYTKDDLDSSVALVSLAGNDYATYLFTNGSIKDLPAFTETVIRQLAINLKRLKSLGVRKIAVTGLEPFGCLPASTVLNSHQSCIEFLNKPSKFHNMRLRKSVKILNKESDQKSSFIILNLYKSFSSALKIKKHQKAAGSLKFNNRLTPCCAGVSSEYSCGSVDNKGEKKYSVCKDPELSFFWDAVHTSQSGWHEVFPALKSSLHRLYK